MSHAVLFSVSFLCILSKVFSDILNYAFAVLESNLLNCCPFLNFHKISFFSKFPTYMSFLYFKMAIVIMKRDNKLIIKERNLSQIVLYEVIGHGPFTLVYKMFIFMQIYILLNSNLQYYGISNESFVLIQFICKLYSFFFNLIS